MARTNLEASRTKPTAAELVTLRVLRRERVSPSFARVTLGDGDVDRFAPMGFDQWFRLFIPVDDGAGLARLPRRLDTFSYLRYLTISKVSRPVLRNYTVRGFRTDGPDGPELDVDFVLHGSAEDGTSGPAATWAATCRPGTPVALLDEGIGFPAGATDRVRLVGDETALPAIAGILAALPVDAVGSAVLEVPDAADRTDLIAPPGVDVTWLVRGAGGEAPGALALAYAAAQPVDGPPWYGWVAGEQALATGVRRAWVAAGQPKERVSFCGYWKDAHRR